MPTPEVQQAQAAGEGWYSESWSYRKKIPLVGAGDAGTNYQKPSGENDLTPTVEEVIVNYSE